MDVSQAIRPLLDMFQKYDMNEDILLHAIMEAIAKERDAQHELAFLCATPVGQWLHDPDGYLLGETQLYANEATRLANAMHRLGLHMVKKFQQYKLYQRGYLPYQHHSRFGQNLVVARLIMPKLEVPFYKTPDRFDLDSFYDRFEIR